jgi:ATP-dependent DNA helicase RecG
MFKIIKYLYNENGMSHNCRLIPFSPGRLTPELSIEKLKQEHTSYPTNPRLAEPMHQAGYIERFGTGTEEMFRLTKEAGLSEPEFDLEEGFKVTIRRLGFIAEQAIVRVTGEVTEVVRRVILALTGEAKRIEMQELLQLKHEDYFRDNYLNPAMEAESNRSDIGLPVCKQP